MFGLAWTEIALIGVVAMVLIGPKDLPIAVKAVAEVVKKARRMAGEFQVHVDEMMRDSNLRDVRDSIAEIRRMDITGDIRRAVDADGSLHSALNENPFQQNMVKPAGSMPAASGRASGVGPGPFAAPVPSITEDAIPAANGGHPAGTLDMHPAAPSFIPPAEATPTAAAALVAPAAAAAPSFIPPGVTLAGVTQPGVTQAGATQLGA